MVLGPRTVASCVCGRYVEALINDPASELKRAHGMLVLDKWACVSWPLQERRQRAVTAQVGVFYVLGPLESTGADGSLLSMDWSAAWGFCQVRFHMLHATCGC